MEAIKTSGLVKRYKDKTAVNGLDLTVHKGELYALLGVNGAGKSTTIKMLSCLTRPTSGDAEIMGHSIVTQADAVKAVINVSPQETAVAAKLSVRENLEFIARIYGADKANARKKADRMIEQLSMEDIVGSKAAALSGGWQRRLSIAMALITDPQVLFLDEPTLGLDVLARRELWSLIEKLKGKMTVILTTHYLEEAESLSDRIGIMARGVLKAEGTAAELKAKAGTDDFEEAFISIAEEVRA
ncbi:MAG: ABC transporter ATP-binding protein [Ruminococcus sp.]|nr:ABC transporter ATP-binding protein [Ruminococcus sp.]